jgi:hypothetical protein
MDVAHYEFDGNLIHAVTIHLHQSGPQFRHEISRLDLGEAAACKG